MAKRKDKTKKPGRSIEVSVPADVSEITIKIEKTDKKVESQPRRQLLG